MLVSRAHRQVVRSARSVQECEPPRRQEESVVAVRTVLSAPATTHRDMPRLSPAIELVRDSNGNATLQVSTRGEEVLRDPLVNKGTAFTREERAALGLEGLLPPAVETLEKQIDRAYSAFHREPSSLAKHRFLRALQDRQETLYYALLSRHLHEMLPIVYTPTVGEGVQQFHAIYEDARGLSLSVNDVDRVDAILAAHPLDDVRMIVATDSSAILGIGDQGYGGLGISIGKLALYTVGGGVSPYQTLPVVLDVGTDRLDLIDDPLYLGVRQRRLRGDDYLRLLDAFVAGVRKRWPRAVVQWEDLSKDTAFTVLDRYRDRFASFNDDVQGTGAVALAGVLSACRLKGEKLRDQRVVVSGAGAGGAGVAMAIREGMVRDGLTPAEANARVFVLDSKGLLTEGRAMEDYKRTFAWPRERLAGWRIAGEIPTLQETIENAKPTVLLGLSGQSRSFDERVIRAMAKGTQRPIVFPLSNPTSACEALPEDIVAWTEGRAIVATGSPFAPVFHGGHTYVVGQGNNAFIFPGLGQGAILCGARRITDAMVQSAAYALSDLVAARYPQLVYPPVEALAEASIRVAARVIQQAIADGVASEPIEDEKAIEALVRRQRWLPEYVPVVPTARR
jgi:malate dehydrogenase (oxaloacetate-decarboxylating)